VHPEGAWNIFWDGRDSDGAPVQTGVYVIIVAVDGRIVYMQKTIKYASLQ
jgi:hypothetical protein